MRKPYGGALAITTSIGNIVRFDFRKGCQAVLWHAANIYVKKGSCMDEHDSKVFDTNIVQNLENPESMMIYCVMLRRVDKFQAEYNLCPGEFNDQVEPDIVKLKTSLTKLLSEWECGHYPKMITCFADSAAQNCILYRHFWADLQRKKLS